MSIPHGWKLVPVEPTQEMKTAGIAVEVYPDSPPEIDCLTWEEVRAIYQDMIAAAPTPPAQDAAPEPPPECQTEAEKRAFVFGWWRAMESARGDAELLRHALDVLEQLQGGCTDAEDGTVEAITVWCPELIAALRERLGEKE